MTEKDITGEALAYLGDAVVELMVREKVIELGVGKKAGALNKMSRDYVTASAQSAAVDRILSFLTDEELTVYKRGRNLNGTSIPKSSSAGDYRRATGLESLFAHLYLNGQTGRMNELFNIAFTKTDAKGEIRDK